MSLLKFGVSIALQFSIIKLEGQFCKIRLKGGQILNDKLSKEQLIKLVEEIVNPHLSEEEIGEKIELLERNVTHPAPSDIIFWNKEELSSTAIVEQLLKYKPISL
jgi:hypothetical protein